MIRAALLLVVLLPLPALGEPSTYRIDSTRTYAEFEVGQLGMLRAHGRFPNVTGTLRYDASAQTGAIDLAIPISSVATGWDSRDRFLRSAGMFDAAEFPSIRFVSKRLAFEGGRVVRVDGDLTLRDVTRPVSLDVRTMHCQGRTCAGDASGEIRRRDFSIGGWWPLVGDEVALHVHLLAVDVEDLREGRGARERRAE